MSLFNLLLETIQYKIVKCIIMALYKNKSKLIFKNLWNEYYSKI